MTARVGRPTSAEGGPVVEMAGDVDPAVVAVLTAAVQAVWPRPPVDMTEPDLVPAWRFSGRWWARPATARRDRPWT